MLFNSIDFLIFFPIVSLIYFLIPHKIRYIWLLLASYYFYMCWNAKYALLLLFSTVVTYLSGWLMEKTEESPLADAKKQRLKKYFVAGSLFLNLSILFLFKYFNFAVENANRVLGKIGVTLLDPGFDLILPVGISFYIFQALSYTMDVYRREICAEKNFFKYALFVSFFPQLVAGPIERSKNLIRQLHERHRFDFDRMRRGLLTMLWGYFLKLVIADRIGIFVDTVYGDVRAYPGMYLTVASVLFAFQIYCDFAGYSTIAIGCAQIMGFRLMENFNCPYFARTVADFWRRWHISLTSWFRDYLYIPLGGNRKGTLRKYVNIMIVFLVSGLWHGANWTYVVWGGLNGLFQVIASSLAPVRALISDRLRLQTESIGHRLLKTLTTFVLVDLTWIFFRASNIREAAYIIKSILTTFNPWILFDGSLYKLGLSQRQFGLALFSIGILWFADYMKYKKVDIIEKITGQNLWCRWLVYLSCVMFILLFGIWGLGYDAQAFVYFQF